MLRKVHLKYLYIFTMAIAMFSRLPGINISWYLKYAHCILWIFLGLMAQRDKGTSQFENPYLSTISQAFATPYLIFWFCTPLGILTHLNDFSLNMMTRGISTTLQFMLILLSVISTIYIFGDKLVQYTFEAMIFNYLIVILRTIQYFGISEFMRTGFRPWDESAYIWSRKGNVNSALEVHDLTFAAGFFLIYFLIWKENDKKKIKNMLITIMIIYLGFKRAELLGIAVVMLLSVFIRKNTKKSIHFWANTVTICVLTAVLGYMWIIKSGFLDYLVQIFQINTKGRIRVYDLMKQYYEFSPLYFGRGFKSAARLNQALSGLDSTVISGHNDVLETFIDIGFLGTIAWICFCVNYVSKKLNRRHGPNSAKIWLLFTTYAFVTYLTDNTTLYLAFQSVYMIIVYHTMVFEDQKAMETFEKRKTNVPAAMKRSVEVRL